MIDEKKLIECLKYDMSCFETDGKNVAQLYVSVADMVRMINGQPKVGGWIPCKDRLPENISTVIVQVKEIEKPTFGWYEDMEKKWILSEKDFVDLKEFTAIAWQPLPEAYHEQVEEGKR